MSLEDLSIEARDELAALAKQLAENPATRKKFLRMTREVKPDLPIPEIEIEEYADKRFSEANNKVQMLEAKIREKEALEELQNRRKNLLKKGLVQQESEIDEVEKIMLEKGITNHEAAAEYWSWMRQAAAPTSSSSYTANALSKFDLSQYWKNPIQGARKEAEKALQELRVPRRPIGL